MGRRQSKLPPRGPDDRPTSAVRRPGDRFRLAAACGLLLLAVGLVFGQTGGFDFVNYDDDRRIRKPTRYRPTDLGGRLGGIYRRHVESWSPLTCVSHMLAWHLLGHGPAAHHLTNVVLHAARRSSCFWCSGG